MAEVKFNGPLYKVTMTEYERGYGQRPMGRGSLTTRKMLNNFVSNILAAILSAILEQSIVR